MANFQVTIFNEVMEQGWTMTFYRSGGTVDEVAKSAPMLSLLIRIRETFGDSARLVAYRVTQLDGVAAGDSQVYDVAPDDQLNPTRFTPVPGVVMSVGDPGDAVLAYVHSAGRQRRQVWFRGLPDGLLERNLFTGTYLARGELLNRCRDCLDELVANDWLIQAREPASVNPRIRVVNITTTLLPSPRYVIETAEDAFLPTGALYHLYKLPRRSYPGICGDFVAFSLGGSTTQGYVPFNVPAVIPAFEPGPEIRKVALNYFDVARYNLHSEVKNHQTGRSFFVPAGRSSKRSCCR